MNLYTDSTATTQLTDNDITTMHNGFTGGHDVFTAYLKANDQYLNVEVQLTFDATDSENGWGGKVYLGDDNLSEEEWDELQNSVTIADLPPNVIRALQFRVYVPAGEASNYHTEKVKLKITGVKVVD